jgi:hypothetical protein
MFPLAFIVGIRERGPAAQAEQIVKPVEAPNLPLPHGEQTVSLIAALAVENLPAEHASQFDASVAALYVPAGQSKQGLNPAGA